MEVGSDSPNMSSRDSGISSQSSRTDLNSAYNVPCQGACSTVAAHEAEPYTYSMSHGTRGKFIVINNKIFKDSKRLPRRDGTDQDAAGLVWVFKNLGFDVTRYNDQTQCQMLELMSEASGEDHANNDCFGVAVLSHGEDGYIYGTDKKISIENLICPIKNCPTLSGKPKLFFFQACRGIKTDAGRVVSQHDGTGDQECHGMRIPLESDFLYAYSTVPGHISWGNRKGCWYVQAILEVFSKEEFLQDLDLVRLLTRVNHIVAYRFMSDSSKHLKQAPSFVSMLTKDLYFRAKS